MPTLKVLYRRTFSYEPYETQVIELGYEEEANPVDRATVRSYLKQMYKDLEGVGDQIMAEALAKGGKKR